MQNQLRFSYFAVQKEQHISSEDLTNLRELYGSILGAEPIFLYETLLDFSKGTNFQKTSIDFNSLSIFCAMEIEHLEIARKKLEAIGLINTYYDNKKAITVFTLQKPLDAIGIKNNMFISDLIIQKLGKSQFDFMIKNKSKKVSVLSGKQYEDATTSFFEMFNLEKQEEEAKRVDQFLIDLGKRTKSDLEIKQMSKSIKPTAIKLEFGNTQYSNEYEALLKLTIIDFYKQLLDHEPNEAAQNYLIDWKKKLADDKTINLVMYLAFLKQGHTANKSDRWLKLANTLIKEVTQKEINGFENIENYLDGKFEFSNEYNDVYKQKNFLKALYLNNNK
ncbi:hypothetical protein [Mycoplasma hafezii]|uniref:hypothetical protein n=1 Tax=Mycoplasma hafezii TaxID=525886 RepID=UPI003CF984E1